MLEPAGPTWSTEPEEFAGDIGATVSLNRADWEARGARFSEIDDALGETTRIAAGTIQTSTGEIAFGILDFDGDDTYLLAPATDAENERLTALTVDALVEAEVVSAEDVLDDRSPFRDEEALLAQRVAFLEQWAGELAADVPATTVVPTAVDVEIPDEAEIVEAASEPGTIQVRAKYSPKYPGGAPSFGLERHVGVIKDLNLEKGIGIIEPFGGGKAIIIDTEEIAPLKPSEVGKTVTFRYGLKPKFSKRS